MIQKLLFTLAFIFSFGHSFGQNWDMQTGILFQPSRQELPNTNLNGLYISSNYSFTQFNHFTLFGGLEFQGNSWANHLLVNTGIKYPFFQKDNWLFDTQLSIGNGMALFQPTLLYSHSSKILFFANYMTKKENHWGIGIGAQFITTPSYKNFSTNFNAWNLPLVARFGFF